MKIASQPKNTPAPGPPDGALTITEIYKSVQGESTLVGLPCIFVRLTGCNLRCVWCDTEYAFYGGVKKSVAEIVEECAALDCSLEPTWVRACATSFSTT